ncbi:MAG: carbohydrate ABC transporter permease [Bifidobacteriaceae bacterium]|jgi:multiple sugar transport system permease protein|nr:carbohydrate ABC transporter permease [Bifidobacteriaceae bacterium]
MSTRQSDKGGRATTDRAMTGRAVTNRAVTNRAVTGRATTSRPGTGRRPKVPKTTQRQGRGPRENPVSVFGSTAFMALFAVYFLTPLWWVFVASTKTRSSLASSFGLWFSSDFQLGGNLRDLAAENGGRYLRWCLNSLLYAGVGGAIATLIAAMMGYALGKYAFRGREAMFNVILCGILMPGTVLALPLFLLFNSAGLVNTFWAVFLPSLVSPFGVYLARIYAASAMPDEVMEAARIDGSGELRTFATIGLRIMAPALVTMFLFQFTQIWNNFFLPLVMLQNDRLYPVSLGLYSWNSQIYYAPQLRMLVIVGSFVAVVPVIIAFLLLQRYWRTGLTEGSVK